MDKSFTSYQIEERSYVSYIKREIHGQVARAKFNESKVGEIDIIVSEITSNLIKHAGKGELLFRILENGESDLQFEIISIDGGPGMTDTARMMKDGVSTTNTLGQGLGAISRLSDLAQIYSMPGWGTILYSLVKSKEEKAFRSKDLSIDFRTLCIPKPREVVCGDGYRVRKTESVVMVFFGDGLGHGVHAKNAVDQAGDFFMECTEREPVDIIKQMHEHSRRTRGLVTSIAICNLKTNEWRICGVGNIFTRMYTGIQFKNYMPYNGTVGLNLPSSMNSSVFPCEKNQHLIMCSDGIQTRWDLAKYPAILKYDNSILAATLYKDFSRRNDDASVLIAKVT
jgi:anti-sigma regulatory factor (Ser/Thr protein kinase)